MFDGLEDLPPEIRSKFILNRAHVPEIARCVANNPTDDTLSEIAVCIDGKVQFDSATYTGHSRNVGTIAL